MSAIPRGALGSVGLLTDISIELFEALFDVAFEETEYTPEPTFALDLVYAACGL